MTDPNNREQVSDEEIAARTGFGGPAASQDEETDDASEEDAEDTDSSDDEDEESEEDEEDTSDSDEDEDSEDDDESADDSDEEDEDDEEESDEDEESEDEDSDEDDDNTDRKPRGKEKKQRTVPYSKLKSERTKTRDLAAAITGIHEALTKIVDKKPEGDSAQQLSKLKERAATLAKDFKLDPAGLEKILEASVELAKEELGGSITPELKEQLKLLEEVKKDKAEQAETAHFETEWNTLGTSLKKSYPNASASMLEEAKKAMDELAHSKKHHTHDLDYILYKNRKKFDTLLKAAPGTRSGETGKHVGTFEEGDDAGEERLVNIEDLTPDIMRARERKESRGSMKGAPRGASSSDEEYSDITIIDPLEDE